MDFLVSLPPRVFNDVPHPRFRTRDRKDPLYFHIWPSLKSTHVPFMGKNLSTLTIRTGNSHPYHFSLFLCILTRLAMCFTRVFVLEIAKILEKYKSRSPRVCFTRVIPFSLDSHNTRVTLSGINTPCPRINLCFASLYFLET